MKKIYISIFTLFFVTSLLHGEMKDTIPKSSISFNLLAPLWGEIQFDYRHYILHNKLELSIKPKIRLSADEEFLLKEDKFEFVYFAIPIGVNYDILKHLYTGIHTATYFNIRIKPGLTNIYPIIGTKWILGKKILITGEIGYGLSMYYSDNESIEFERNFCHGQLGIGFMINTKTKKQN